MCGIAGIISKKNRVINIEDIDAMLLAQKHRGPDDFGVAAFDWRSEHLRLAKYSLDFSNKQNISGVIGHNRLSILDLSEFGHQPMVSRDGKIGIVYNGEVYNAFDFKKELEKDGLVFKSETDTEIILNLYIKYGIERTLMLLNGMFAFCIVDLAKKKMYWARDRVGIKPLYYYNTDEEFVFASELKSLIKRRTVKRELDLDAVEEYFTFRSCCADSLMKDVYQVKPGEYIEMDNHYNIKKVRWFDVNSYSRENSIKKEYKNLINEAVNSQMVSDVKVGCQLSGGIDSSLVSYFAKNTGYEDAISIVFADKSFSEEKYINYVTDTLEIKSHKKLLDVNYMVENWEHMNWHMDTIVNHPNTMGIMALAEESKKYVTVLLSGEGADETAGGYSNFLAAYIVDICNKKTPISYILRKKYSKLLRLYRNDERQFFIQSHGYTCSEDVKNILLKSGSGKYLNKRKQRIDCYTGSVFDKMIKYDIEFYLPELLMRQDKMTMKSSIENRVPLLDNRLMDYLLQCDKNELIGWKRSYRLSLSINDYLVGKKIMKKLSEKIYGREFTYRKKCGFALPVKDLFHDERFRRYIEELILPGIKKRGIINCDFIMEILNNIENADKDKLELLWRVFSFETWCELFIDGRATISI